MKLLRLKEQTKDIVTGRRNIAAETTATLPKGISSIGPAKHHQKHRDASGSIKDATNNKAKSPCSFRLEKDHSTGSTTRARDMRRKQY